MKKLDDIAAEDATLAVLRADWAAATVLQARETLVRELARGGFRRVAGSSGSSLEPLQAARLSYRRVSTAHVREHDGAPSLMVCANLWAGARPRSFGASRLTLEVLRLDSILTPEPRAQRILASRTVTSTVALARREREEFPRQQLAQRLSAVYSLSPLDVLETLSRELLAELTEALAP